MTVATIPVDLSQEAWDVLKEPRSVEETGLSMGFLTDLVLKVIYFAGEITAQDIADTVKLPFINVVEPILDFLKREELIGVTGSRGISERSFQYTIAEKGIKRAREALERSQYVGPAPVPIESYRKVVVEQKPNKYRIGPEDVRAALSHLVVPPETIDRIGPAVNSGRSFFLYGPPGNGKTAIASSITRMMKGDIYIPYAIAVGGSSIIKVFDTLVHEPVEEEQETDTSKLGTSSLRPKTDHLRKSETGRLNTSSLQPKRIDRRWVKIKRPTVMVGGELTLEMLDLIYDPISKTYEAPLQMKANGGLFLVDDFGRQQMRPQDLLNRWIVPLELRIDFLTLQNGMKIEIPFETFIVFSTNLDPKDLVDEAFLRRLRHKLEIPNPTDRQFYEIFRRVCAAKGIEFNQKVFVYLLREYYIKQKRELKSAHPRDLIDQILDIAAYRGIRPAMTKELIDQACDAYFVEF